MIDIRVEEAVLKEDEAYMLRAAIGRSFQERPAA